MFKDNSANISMDFLTAIGVILIAIIYTVSALPGMFVSYTSEDNYQHLDNTLSVLLSQNNENGFISAYSSSISSDKVAELYITHENNLNWYELSDTQSFRTLGFQKYHYYSQIIPVDTTKYNAPLTEENAKSYVPELCNTDLVVRFKLLEYTERGVFYGKDLHGKLNPTKPIIYFDENDTRDIGDNITLTFKEFIPKSVNKGIKDFRIGYEVDESSEEVKPNVHIHPDVYVNGNKVEYDNDIDINLTDKVKIVLNLSMMNTKLPQWRDGFVFQFNFDGIEIQQGETYYNSSVKKVNKPYKIVIWSWYL